MRRDAARVAPRDTMRFTLIYERILRRGVVGRANLRPRAQARGPEVICHLFAQSWIRQSFSRRSCKGVCALLMGSINSVIQMLHGL